MVREGAVNGGRSDLHHFEAVRAFEHAMPDFRGLEDEIAGIQNEWCALTLIDHADPPASDVKRLSSDPMEMHPVDDRASFGNGDVRCNVAAAQAIGDQVAVQHARPALTCRIAGAREHESRLECRQRRRRLACLRTRGQPDCRVTVGQDRAVRVVGRIDVIQPKTFPPKIVEREVQVLADDLLLAQPFLAGFFAAGFFAAGFFVGGWASTFACGALRPGSSLSGFAGFGLSSLFSTAPFAGSSG